MSKQADGKTLDDRVTALENEVRMIHSQLDDIREIITRGFDVLFDANGDRSRSLQRHARHIEEIEERLDPTFHKVFPQQAEFISETQAVFDNHRKRPS